MEVDSAPPSPPPAQQASFTTADRIAELNDIDRSISTLLSAASDAIGILSNSPTSELQEKTLKSSTSARTAFTAAAATYFSTLSSIEVRLRRQVYALEEVDLIRQGDERDARKGRSLGNENGMARVGGGPLDPSWLNARASDKVGIGKKRELLAQAREFVERLEQDAQNGGDNSNLGKSGAGKAEEEDQDQEMG